MAHSFNLVQNDLVCLILQNWANSEHEFPASCEVPTLIASHFQLHLNLYLQRLAPPGFMLVNVFAGQFAAALVVAFAICIILLNCSSRVSPDPSIAVHGWSQLTNTHAINCFLTYKLASPSFFFQSRLVLVTMTQVAWQKCCNQCQHPTNPQCLEVHPLYQCQKPCTQLALYQLICSNKASYMFSLTSFNRLQTHIMISIHLTQNWNKDLLAACCAFARLKFCSKNAK